MTEIEKIAMEAEDMREKVCVYVCMCVCVCMYVCVHVHMYVFMYEGMNVCIYL